MPILRKKPSSKISKVKQGFTLIELLVVIAIIGILASFAIASFTSAQAKGRDSKRKADLDAIKKALELFKGDTTGAAYFPGAISTAIFNPSASISYIRTLPTGPSSGETYAYTPGGTGCNTANTTTANANCSDYRLTAVLENSNDPQRATSTDNLGSAAKCAEAYGVEYADNTYVICPD